MKVFVSSTYADLGDHRAAVGQVLLRMQVGFAAMEHFGSRADEAIPACRAEIAQCDILVGIYAWRYGWQPTPTAPSITEEEFDYARSLGKRCLCYVVDESFSWPPVLMDRGEAAVRLEQFKRKVSQLVRSTFTNPDNLAKQVAADLAREMAPPVSPESFGRLLRVNWEVFSPELQDVLSAAYTQARVDASDGVVASRHVISALADLPNTARPLLAAFRDVQIAPLDSGSPSATVHELFGYDRPISSCVLASMHRLLPLHSVSQRLLAIELAVDLLKYGRGDSVAQFRRAGIDADAVDRTLEHITRVATSLATLEQALGSLGDAEVLRIAYISGIELSEGAFGRELRAEVLREAKLQGRMLVLVGELMRRHHHLVILA